MLPEPIGIRIQRFRENRGWTQDMLSARMQTRGHSTLVLQRISEIENGKRVVRPEELVSFARVLGVPINELLGVPNEAREPD